MRSSFVDTIAPISRLKWGWWLGCAALLLSGSGEVIAGAGPGPGDNAAARPAIKVPATETNTLQSIERGAKSMIVLVRSLQATVQRTSWNSRLQGRNVNELRATAAGMRQDHEIFQARNQAANTPEAEKVSRELQERLEQVDNSLNMLGGARHAAPARGALSDLAASLGGIVKSIETMPRCCAEGTCCQLGIQ